MRSILLLASVSSVELLTAGQPIRVAVCNTGGVSEAELSSAKAETEAIYRNVGVAIVWGGCDSFRGAWFPAPAPTFLIRLQNEQPAPRVGPASLDVMGQAFVEACDGGNTAEAYLPAIRASAELYHADQGVLLGFVLAHELGHLLLGPGHTPDGLMQAVWGRKQMDALRQRQLGFTKDCAERIRLKLKLRRSPGQRDRAIAGSQ